MALLDGPGFFRNTIIPSIGGVNAARRIPFTFTSTARLIKSGKVKSIGNLFSRANAEQNRKTQLGLIEAETRGFSVASQLGFTDLLSVTRNVAQQITGFNMPVIAMSVNPHTIKWSQNKRIVKRDTMEGSTYFHFTNSVDQNNDILQVSFNGRTGNINTSVNFLDALVTGANLKLRIWHELYSLSREGILLNPANTGVTTIPRGIPNEFFITYRSVLMPIQIVLIGFFQQVLDFTETAEDPNNRDYSFTFTVTDTRPKLDELVGLMSSRLTTIGAAESLGSQITALGGDPQAQ